MVRINGVSIIPERSYQATGATPAPGHGSGFASADSCNEDGVTRLDGRSASDPDMRLTGSSDLILGTASSTMCNGATMRISRSNASTGRRPARPVRPRTSRRRSRRDRCGRCGRKPQIWHRIPEVRVDSVGTFAYASHRIFQLPRVRLIRVSRAPKRAACSATPRPRPLDPPTTTTCRPARVWRRGLVCRFLRAL